ncbi:MAG TPA: hypothetical protein VGD21_16730 [Lysobacter sp.]
MRRFPLVLSICAVLMVGACQKPAPPAETARPGAEAPAPVTAEVPKPDDGITMRYRCESGHSVAIVRGERARVTLADGRVVEIARVADSSPPQFEGEALSFEVTGDGATLGQHEVGGFACTAED